MVRRRLSAQARRAQLISVAREVFVADGYDGAAMEQIATRAGVTKPVLYQHFESKKELYLALLEEDMAELQGLVERALDEARSNRERIQRSLAAYFEFIEANEGSFHLLFRETLGAEPDFKQVIERFRDSVAARIGKIIAEDALLPVDESELLARGVMGMGESAAQWWLERGSVDKTKVLKDLSELAWRGLSGLPRRP
ncbi:MAG: TetR/AcrR family transcriptional regulator [Actinomycetota bacterium]